ncbi:WYL domain-containing protein [Sporolactobacillus shoreae]|uniref:WYL domain-containing protein n=1 Tax=Sporolactobacillus shoreae TaxID=1465501 RepID=A0A4Z0GJW2_9BACL|nr:WYL domain-containing protein [Sporolactobacillus shoreae]
MPFHCQPVALRALIYIHPPILKRNALYDFLALFHILKTERAIQPVGIYANNGLWYCPAYCFLRNDFRIFRCDKMHSATFDHTNREPIDLRNIHLGNKESLMQRSGGSYLKLYVELQQEGVNQCEAHLWLKNSLHVRADGSGWLDGSITARELTFFASFILGLGNKATIKEPPELVGKLEKLISEVIKKYGQSNSKGLSR